MALSPSPSLPPYPDRFYAAAQYAGVAGTVEVDPKAAHPAKPFSDLTSLLLYSLFQQASHGPCTTQKPWFINVVESAKWASWNELGKMAPVEAMRLFVRTLEEEDPNWWTKSQAKPGGAPETLGVNGNDVEEFDENAKLSSQLPFLPNNKWEPLDCKGRKPAPRYQHASALISQRMYVIGGNCNGRFLNDIHVLDLTNLTWSKLETPAPSVFPPCAGHRVVQKDSRTLLVIGGHSHEGVNQLAVRAFNIYTRQWSLVKTQGEPPSARGGHSVSQIGTSLWLFGGEDLKRRLLDDIHVLDMVSWTWRTFSASGDAPSPRADHAVAVRENRYLTVFGGGSHSSCFQDLYELDVEMATWSRRSSGGTIPGGRSGHAAVACENIWYIVGGGDNKGGSLETVSLNLDTFTWSVMATVSGRTAISSEGLSVVTHGEEEEERIIFSFGGYSGRYHNEVYAFRPAILPVIPSEEVPLSAEQLSGQPEVGKKSEESVPAEKAEADKSEEPSGQEADGKDKEDDITRQLEEAAEMAAKAEKAAMSVRADAEYKAAKARADAWAAIGKAKMDEEELKERLAAAIKAKEKAEVQTEEARNAIVAVQQATQTAHAEASRLRKELQESRTHLAEAQIRALRVEENAEIVKLQKDYGAAKSVLADTEQELLSVRGSLAQEQARCFRLEVEVAELRQRLQGMEALERELELLRRQKAASDEAAAAAAQKSAPGVWGWLAGPSPPTASKA